MQYLRGWIVTSRLRKRKPSWFSNSDALQWTCCQEAVSGAEAQSRQNLCTCWQKFLPELIGVDDLSGCWWGTQGEHWPRLLLISLADCSQRWFIWQSLIHYERNNEGILFVSDANCLQGKVASIVDFMQLHLKCFHFALKYIECPFYPRWNVRSYGFFFCKKHIFLTNNHFKALFFGVTKYVCFEKSLFHVLFANCC